MDYGSNKKKKHGGISLNNSNLSTPLISPSRNTHEHRNKRKSHNKNMGIFAKQRALTNFVLRGKRDEPVYDYSHFKMSKDGTPEIVLSDTSILNSLSKKDFICGYAEILKHAIIKDKNFFYWLKKNSKNIFSKKPHYLNYAIKKSCMIKMFFVNQDVNEKNQRMILNFGHTFAHALEIKNKLSKKISHGEAVLSGMILEARLSVLKGLCSYKTLNEIVKIYKENNLSYTFKDFSNYKSVNELIPFLKNDKKNDDKKINFILLKSIGKTAQPNKNKINLMDLKKFSNLLINRNF